MAELFGLGRTRKSARRRVQIHVAHLTERASRAVGEFDGYMPVESRGIKGRGGGVDSRAKPAMQPSIDRGQCGWRSRHRR